jgi:hypothetical protein
MPNAALGRALADVELPNEAIATARLKGAPNMSETLVGYGHPRHATGGGNEMHAHHSTTKPLLMS